MEVARAVLTQQRETETADAEVKVLHYASFRICFINNIIHNVDSTDQQKKGF